MNLVLFVWLMVVFVLFLRSFPTLCAGERSELAQNVGKEKFISKFSGPAMHLLRRSHSQGRVRPAMVIQMYSAIGRLSGFKVVFKIGIQPIFLFENSVNTFGQGILGAVVLFGHAHFQTRCLDAFHIFVGRVLAPAIRMMNGPLASLETSEGHAQSFQTVRSFQRFS